MELLEKLNSILGSVKKTNITPSKKAIILKTRIEKVKKRALNNEIFGNSAEIAICEYVKNSKKVKQSDFITGFEPYGDKSATRYSPEYAKQIQEFIKDKNDIKNLLNKIVKYVGEKRNPIDFILENNGTLSIKTAGDYRISPQEIGQTTSNVYSKNLNRVIDVFMKSDIAKENVLSKLKNFINRFLPTQENQEHYIHGMLKTLHEKNSQIDKIDKAKQYISDNMFSLIYLSIRNSIFKADYTLFLRHKKFVIKDYKIFSKQNKEKDFNKIFNYLMNDYDVISTQKNWETQTNTIGVVKKGTQENKFPIISFQVKKDNVSIVVRIQWRNIEMLFNKIAKENNMKQWVSL